MVSLTNTNCTWKWILFDCDSPCNVPKRDLKQVLSLLNTWHNFGPQIVRAHSAFSICWLFLLKPTITECWVWIDHLLRNIRQGGRIYIRTIVTSFSTTKRKQIRGERSVPIWSETSYSDYTLIWTHAWPLALPWCWDQGQAHTFPSCTWCGQVQDDQWSRLWDLHKRKWHLL